MKVLVGPSLNEATGCARFRNDDRHIEPVNVAYRAKQVTDL